MAEAFAEGRGRAQADTLRSMRKETVAHDARRLDARRPSELARGDIVVVDGRRADPRRRHRDRGHRLGRRVGDHRRVGAGDPRVRRRPQRRHRRHARHLRRDRRRDHPGAGPVVPRPDDRARRGRRAAQDAERDRAQHPARGADADLHDRRRDAAPVRRCSPAHVDLRDDADRAARRADPDDDRRAALARSGSPAWTGSCAATCSRSPAARSRPPATSTCCCSTRPARSRSATGSPREFIPMPGVAGGRARRGRAALLARRRDARGPLDRRARQAVRHPRARHGDAERRVRPVHRPDAHERRRHRRPRSCARAPATSIIEFVEARRRLAAAASCRTALDRIGREGGTPLAVARDSQVLGVDLPQGHGQGGHARALRPAARDGHPHGDGHRRQPPDRGEDRRGGRRRRLPRRSDARAQARADPGAAGRRAGWSR